jgi:hypothetical protein
LVTGKTVWLFQGEMVSQPSAAFSKLGRAVDWIKRHSLSGLLTEYPLNEGVYDWAVRRGFYRPKDIPDPAFVGKFSSASQRHFHFDLGQSVELESIASDLSAKGNINRYEQPRIGADQTKLLWVFLGEQGRHASAVFDDRTAAEHWSRRHQLTGLLKPMPLDVPVYDWAHPAAAQDQMSPHSSDVIANYWVETDRDVSFLKGHPRPAKPADLRVS